MNHHAVQRRLALLGLVTLATGPALAQVLSSPLGAPSAAPPGAPPAAGAAPHGLPQGQGAGVHSPQSPIPPLPVREDVVAWSLLTDVRTEVRGKRIAPVYPADVRALHQRQLKLHGFMLPLDPGENQRHFLLTSVPLSCAFCTPGGPESMVEVRAKSPVKYRDGAVVLEGRFHVLDNDPYGLYYRLSEAVASR
jgi:uncharacterized protein